MTAAPQVRVFFEKHYSEIVAPVLARAVNDFEPPSVDGGNPNLELNLTLKKKQNSETD